MMLGRYYIDKPIFESEELYVPTAASRSQSVDVRTLQVILGHESLATTQIYTAMDNDQLQSAVNSNPLASMFGR